MAQAYIKLYDFFFIYNYIRINYKESFSFYKYDISSSYFKKKKKNYLNSLICTRLKI